MTSRERLLLVLNGKIPDRVPVSTYELVGFDTHNFCNLEPSYQALMNYIREKTDCVAMWDMGSNERFAASSMPVDVKRVERKLSDGYETIDSLQIGARILTSANRRIDNIYTTWTTESWCKNMDDVDAMLSIPYEPVTYDASDYPRILKEVGDHGIIMPSLSDPAHAAMSLMEFSESFLWVMTETDHFAKTVEILHKRKMENLKRALDTQTCDLYRICGPEYMTPPLLPRWCFERFMFPYLKDMTDLIHSRGAKVRLHSHNRIGTLLDLFEKLGVDATDPCEGPPDGDVEFSQLKRRIGEKITLFGNMQLKVLENGTEAEVRAETRRIMDAGKPGGRFVIMPTAAPINVPLSQRTHENYITFIDEALMHGIY